MTEFDLVGSAVLGIMPAAGIRKLLGEELPDPSPRQGESRAEIYLVVDDPLSYHRRAIEAGAREISDLEERSWGHRVAYSIDVDGYVLAFAAPLEQS